MSALDFLYKIQTSQEALKLAYLPIEGWALHLSHDQAHAAYREMVTTVPTLGFAGPTITIAFDAVSLGVADQYEAHTPILHVFLRVPGPPTAGAKWFTFEGVDVWVDPR